ncbi:hypothetical protein LTR50_006714 [Elasticomyces elasticus]|nr:hypothetical protein LTR50_006714 [Elasticomyces elasticus]
MEDDRRAASRTALGGVVGGHERAKRTEPLADQTSVSSSGSYDSAQAGVKKIEAVTTTWTKWSLFMAYAGLYLMAFATSLEGQTTVNLSVFATSAFSAHSLISTVLVIQGVVLSVVKPPMSKIADVFGRFEAFSICVFIFTIGYIQQAASNNVKTYAAAQIFYSAGSTGLQILQQIFVADTSTLLNRALFSTIPDIPYLITVWIGSPIAAAILPNWRWGYGMWAVILPVAFLPLGLSLFLNSRKAARMGLLPPSPFSGQSAGSVLKGLWYELDVFGLLLLSAAIALILIPLTLAASAKRGWSNPSIIAMIVVGCLCMLAFPSWERSKKLAPRAFFPRDLFRNRTVLAGTGIAFFYFMAFYLSVYPYFYSYLLVTQGKSVTAAGHITQTFTFTASVTSIVISVIIKYTKRYKYFVTLGSCIYLMGIGLMIRYRTEGASTVALVGCQIAVGIGGGMLNVPAQLGVQASASHQEVAAATAVFLTILEIGGAVGSAISGAVWTANIPIKLAEYLPAESHDQATAIFGNITLASQGWPMGSPTRIAINRAYQETMTKLLTIAVCVCVPLIPLSLLMKNYKLDEVHNSPPAGDTGRDEGLMRLSQIDQNVRGTVVGAAKAPRESTSEPAMSEPELNESRDTAKVGTIFDRFRKS